MFGVTSVLCSNPATLVFTMFVVLVVTLLFLWQRGILDVKSLFSFSLLTASSAIFVLYFTVATYNTICEIPVVKKQLFTSELEQLPSTPPCYVQRNDVIGDVKAILHSRRLGVYHLIHGPHGSGKTTAIIEAIKASELGGMKYVSVPFYAFYYVQVDFGLFLGKEFGVQMRCLPAIAEPINYFVTDRKCPDSELERVEMCLDILVKAGIAIKRNGLMSPTIIFDNLGNLFHSNNGETILRMLQIWAKTVADMELLNIVFCSSEDRLKLFFSEVSEASRMVAYPVIGDISDTEAFNYIKCREEVPNTVSNETIHGVVQLVGGRFIDIKASLPHLNGDNGGDRVQAVKSAAFDRVRIMLKNLNITATTPEDGSGMSKAAWLVARSIIHSDEGYISEDLFDQITAPFLSIEEQGILLSENIFWNNGRNCVLFH